MAILVVAAGVVAQQGSKTTPQVKIWRFDRTSKIGGYPTDVLGHPRVIQTPYGKAVQFNGVDDALVVHDHPLAGSKAYTWEVIFRPESGGAEAQRFFHLAELDANTGQPTNNRMLFEIRVHSGGWCLDSFADTNGQHRTLLNCSILHPMDQWYRVTAVYDGKELRNYVGDQLQGEGPLTMGEQGQGAASIGMRFNHKFFFKGSVLMARMTPRALPPSAFLKMPAGKAKQGK